MKRTVFSSACAATAAFGIVTIAFSQSAPQPAAPGYTTPGYASADPAASTASEDAEREKIWNSPTMLRARAWVQEYCQRSAKITPEEAQRYMTELSRLSPIQMKLWLLKFEHEEEGIRQQQADFQQSRQAGLAHATSVNSATQQAFANINRDETEAAQGEQQSLDTQQQDATDRSLQKDADQDSADAALGGPLYGPYGGYGGYGGYAPMGAYGAGGYHVHVHVHPQ